MVDLTDAVNSQLHMSFNGVSNSEVAKMTRKMMMIMMRMVRIMVVIILVTNYKQTAFQVEVKVDKSLNTSVHVSFQNPVKTPVKVLKGIIWEIYECASEVLSHLGRIFGVIFRAQWAQKVKHVFPLFGDFLSPLSPKNHTKKPP